MRGNALRGDGTDVSPMKVTPTSGKGTLDTWRFHRQRGVRTQSRVEPTYERELGPGQTTEAEAYANQRLNLAKLGRPWEEMPIFRTGPGRTGCPGLSGGPAKRSPKLARAGSIPTTGRFGHRVPSLAPALATYRRLFPARCRDSSGVPPTR